MTIIDELNMSPPMKRDKAKSKARRMDLDAPLEAPNAAQRRNGKAEPHESPKSKPRRKRLEPATHAGKHVGHAPHLGRGLDEPDYYLLPGDNTWDSDDPDKPLTEQQFVLVHEYLVDMDFAAAMRRAGYRGERNGPRLKKQPNIRKAIAQLLQERRAACRAHSDKVLAQLVRIVDLSVADFVEWESNTIRLKAFATIPAEKLALLPEIKQREPGGWSIKMPDKLAAIDKIMRHLGMFEKTSLGRLTPDQTKANVLEAVRDGKITVDEAILSLDIEGVAIPESLRILASRRKAEEKPPDDGNYSVVSPEEMAERAARRRAEIERQRVEFVPRRQAEVQALKNELCGGRCVQGQE